MNKHLITGVVVGALFALPITWIAAAEAITEGNGLEMLATTVFGLAAGLCIGALIAANFAMLDLEEHAKEQAPASQEAPAHARG